MSVAATLLAASASFGWFTYQGADPVDTQITVAPDEFRNPILQGFYPDPSITQVGEDYYLVHSTFSWFPGVPVWHSRDLVSWKQIGNAIDRPDQLDFGKLGMSRGVFAPAIEHHAGTFYILNTCVDCGGNFVITASDPAGPWSDPVWLPDLEGGIDPSLFVDADGSAWLVNNGPPVGTPRYDGHRAIWIQQFDLATLKTVGERKVLIDGGVEPETNPVWIEGPHIYQHDGWYYLSCAEGGTSVNHSQVILRSRRPDGSYTNGPNPILTQRDLPAGRQFPITAAGHADFVTTPDGRWWASFLAIRPYAEDFHNTGRETFLLPVEWKNGWPQILPPATPIPLSLPRPLPADPEGAPPTSGAFAWREEFDGPALSPEWIGMRIPREQWWDLTANPGALTLQARPDGLGDFANPSFLGRRQSHANASAVTSVQLTGVDGQAGLAAVQNDEYWMAIAITRQGDTQSVRLLHRGGPDEPAAGMMVAEAPLSSTGPVELKAEAAGAAYRFSYRDAAGWHQLGPDQDGTLLSTQTAGGFTGVVFGPFASEVR
ncbi:glycoside hydrolase family 43 protein [Croceibacterium ferulae]|uniref:glycoside hydrolase family 43 protein n=1 Tax=Croceibacterium ferulae TaxID=1854641 RepID=UPI000EAD9B4D|nr:glycoside hydrolase family 43 protein [Croceibacterium ferulae]